MRLLGNTRASRDGYVHVLCALLACAAITVELSWAAAIAREAGGPNYAGYKLFRADVFPGDWFYCNYQCTV